MSECLTYGLSCFGAMFGAMFTTQDSFFVLNDGPGLPMKKRSCPEMGVGHSKFSAFATPLSAILAIVASF